MQTDSINNLSRENTYSSDVYRSGGRFPLFFKTHGAVKYVTGEAFNVHALHIMIFSLSPRKSSSH